MLNPDTTIDKESIIDLYKTSIEYDPVASAPWVEDDKSCYGLLPENGKGIKRSNTEIKSTELLNNRKPDGNCCVEVHKCCALLINKKKFLSVKMFNPEYFLFWEEIDLCRKFRNNKFSLVLNPKCNMIHHEGNSVNDNIATYCIKTFNHEYSPLIYFNVSKLNLNIYWKIIKYFWRAISYLLILNFKNSLKNFLKLLATINYILFK
jgi:GT2 family glycosyltransferase